MPVDDGASTPDVAVCGSLVLRVSCQRVSALNRNHTLQGQGSAAPRRVSYQRECRNSRSRAQWVSRSSSFRRTPAGVVPFAVTGVLDPIHTDVEAGLALAFRKGGTIRIGYTGAFAGQWCVQSGVLKVSVPL
jgi:hypothetical protein